MNLPAMFTHWTARACIAFGIAASAGGAWADTLLATVDSPGKVLTVSVEAAADGRLSYHVERLGKSVLAPSRLGFVLADGAPLDAGFALDSKTFSDHDDTWEQPWGERRFVRDHYREMRVDVRQKSGRRLGIVFRVFDDGVGFRYEFPEQRGVKNVAIADDFLRPGPTGSTCARDRSRRPSIRTPSSPASTSSERCRETGRRGRAAASTRRSCNGWYRRCGGRA